MTVKINADTSDGLKFVSDTSGTVDIQSNGTTKFTVGTTIDCQGNELVLDADADTSIHASTDDQIDFKTGGTDRMAITTDITAPSTVNVKLHGSGSAGTLAGLWIRDLPRVTNDTSTFEHTYINSNNTIFFTKGSSATTSSNSEKMRLDSNGQLLLGSTSQDLGERLHVAHTGGGVVCVMRTVNSSGTVQIGFKNANGFVGEIVTNGSNTSYATSSDYRLKENVTYTFDATSRLKQLKPARFNFKTDADTTLDGFLAHEVSSIVPEAVIGEKDATEKYTDEDGKEQTRDKHQSIDQSKLVPLLVKTIQELEARITTLESE